MPQPSATWQFRWPTGVTTNSLYVRTRHGWRLADAAATWRDEAILIVRQQGDRLPEGCLSVHITAYSPADGRRHDLDNLAKLTIDSVFAAWGDDDARINHLVVDRCPTVHTPYLCVEVQ